jgi:hypothetical protein
LKRGGRFVLETSPFGVLPVLSASRYRAHGVPHDGAQSAPRGGTRPNSTSFLVVEEQTDFRTKDRDEETYYESHFLTSHLCSL